MLDRKDRAVGKQAHGDPRCAADPFQAEIIVARSFPAQGKRHASPSVLSRGPTFLTLINITANQRKLLCANFQAIRETPRCRQSVAHIHALKAGCRRSLCGMLSRLVQLAVDQVLLLFSPYGICMLV